MNFVAAGGLEPSARICTARLTAVDDAMRLSSPTVLRALGNPFRQRILSALVAHEYARATDIARVLGEPVNNVSHHLHVLAEAGLVTEAPERARDRRSRVWKPAASSYVAEGADEMVEQLLGWARALVMEDVEVLPDDPNALRNVSQLVAHLSRDEAVMMSREINNVVLKWNRKAASSRADTSAGDEDDSRTIEEREEEGGASSTRVPHNVVILIGNQT